VWYAVRMSVQLIVAEASVLGLLLGSFLNMVIYRLHAREPMVFARSHCPHCGHTLAWYELFPLLSFFAQRGRCRACSQGISVQYPLVELATGVLFGLLAYRSADVLVRGDGVFLAIACFALSVAVAAGLIVIFVYDLRHYLIPDVVLAPVALAAVVLVAIEGAQQGVLWQRLGGSLFAALGAGAFFLALFLMSKGRWMGFGDVKFAAFMGVLLGVSHTVAALFIAFTSGAIIGLALIVLRRKQLKSQVPFAPFLIAGTMAAWLWGDILITWYFSAFGL
jgi:leader peptidase (prepilin peptidase) / N-methyltransferase